MAEFIGYLFDAIVLFATVRMLYGALRHVLAPRMAASRTRGASNAAGGRSAVRGEMARDPVCGMFVSTELSHRLKSRGQTLHFCSEECLEKYRDKDRVAS
jgi:YHS domain-containing protein